MTSLFNPYSRGFFTYFLVILLATASRVDAQNLSPFFWFPQDSTPETFRVTEQEWIKRVAALDLAPSLIDRKVFEARLHSKYAKQSAILNGTLSFDHPLATYLTEIKNYVLRDNPGLRDSITVTVEVTPDPGAYMSITGELRFTTGLFNRCHTEAQIAGIVAHEVIHLREKHSENAIRSPFGTNDSDVVQLASLSTRYSHRRELEADSKALESFMQQSDYQLEDVAAIFDILAYSYLPLFDEPIPFERLFPDCYGPLANSFIESPRPITPKEKLDDSRSSHPNAYRRQVEYLKKLEESNYTLGSGKLFVLKSASEFKTLQAQLQYEERYIQAVNHNYLHVLFDELLASDGAPSILKVHSLWALTTLRNDQLYDRELGVFSDYEGELSTLYWFMRTIPRKDLTLLAYRHAFEAKKVFPESQLIERVLLSLAHQASKLNSVNELDWSNPALCGISDTAEFKQSFNEGVARAAQSNYFTKAPDVSDLPTAAKRTITPGASTLLPVQIYLRMSELPDPKLINKNRSNLEAYLTKKLTPEIPGKFFPHEATRLEPNPLSRNQIWAMERFFFDVVHMANWNSTVSLFTDEVGYWEGRLTTDRLSQISAISYPRRLVLLTIDVKSQRAVDAVMNDYYPSYGRIRKVANFWLQSLTLEP